MHSAYIWGKRKTIFWILGNIYYENHRLEYLLRELLSTHEVVYIKMIKRSMRPTPFLLLTTSYASQMTTFCMEWFSRCFAFPSLIIPIVALI